MKWYQALRARPVRSCWRTPSCRRIPASSVSPHRHESLPCHSITSRRRPTSWTRTRRKLATSSRRRWNSLMTQRRATTATAGRSTRTRRTWCWTSGESAARFVNHTELTARKNIFQRRNAAVRERSWIDWEPLDVAWRSFAFKEASREAEPPIVERWDRQLATDAAGEDHLRPWRRLFCAESDFLA